MLGGHGALCLFRLEVWVLGFRVGRRAIEDVDWEMGQVRGRLK